MSDNIKQALARIKYHIRVAEMMRALTMDIRPPNTGPIIDDLKTLIAAVEQRPAAQPEPDIDIDDLARAVGGGRR